MVEPPAAAQQQPEQQQENNKTAAEEFHDAAIPLYCQHSPKGWRATLRRVLFPRTHSAMEEHEGRPPLNRQKTIVVDWLDYVVIVLVAITCVLLCLQDPLNPSSSLMKQIGLTNNVLGLLFAVENIVRILCFGFIYFKADYWNIFDSLIVLLTFISTVIDLSGSNQQSGVEALRILILFRPLRSVRFIDTARITMIATLRAFKSIGDVVLLLLLFLLLVATSGVTQYSNLLQHRCFNDDGWNTTITSNPKLSNYSQSFPANYTRFQAYDNLMLDELRSEVARRQCGYRLQQYLATNVTVCSFTKSCSVIMNVSTTVTLVVPLVAVTTTTTTTLPSTVTTTTIPPTSTTIPPTSTVSTTPSTVDPSFSSSTTTTAALTSSTTPPTTIAQTTDTTTDTTTTTIPTTTDTTTTTTIPTTTDTTTTTIPTTTTTTPAPTAVPSTTVSVKAFKLRETVDDRFACIFFDGTVTCASSACSDDVTARTLLFDWPTNVTSGPVYLSSSESDQICGKQRWVPYTTTTTIGNVTTAMTQVTTYCINVDTAASNTRSSGSYCQHTRIVSYNGSQPLSTVPVSTKGTVGVLNQGSAESIHLPFTAWNGSRTMGPVVFPMLGNDWCTETAEVVVPKNVLAGHPWTSPNATFNCTQLNASMAMATDRAVPLCCSFIPDAIATAACCVTPPYTQVPQNQSLQSQAPLCCQDTSSTRILTVATDSATGNVIKRVKSLGQLANELLTNTTTCEAALIPDINWMTINYFSYRSSADAELTYWTPQQRTWNVSLSLNASEAFTLASCTPPNSLLYNVTSAYLSANVTLAAGVAATSSTTTTTTTTTVPPSTPSGPNNRSFVLPSVVPFITTPPLNFKRIDQASSPVKNPDVNQTVEEPCAVQTTCYSVPVSEVINYNCLGTAWTQDMLADLPRYDEAFRGMERRATGPIDWEQFSWIEHNCDASDTVLLSGYRCPYGYRCVEYQNPFHGKLGFNNLAKSMLTDFTCITLQSWYVMMYRTMDAVDSTAAVYFILISIIGALFITNLMIVLMLVEFDDCVKEERKLLEERRAERLQQKRLRRMNRKSRSGAQQGAVGDAASMSGSTVPNVSMALSSSDNNSTKTEINNGSMLTEPPRAAPNLTERRTSLNSVFGDDDPFADKKKEGGDDDEDENDSDEEEELNGERGGDVLNRLGVFLQRQLDNETKQRRQRRRILRHRGGGGGGSSAGDDTSSQASGGGIRHSDVERSSYHSNDPTSTGAGGGVDGGDTEMLEFSDGNGEGNNNEFTFRAAAPASTSIKKMSRLQRIRFEMRENLESKTGLLFINFTIFANMVVLGSAYYGMSDAVRNVLDILNFAFTIIFTVELCYRLFCVDIWIFVRSTMSVIDVFVIIASWVDFAVPSVQFPIIRGVRVIRLLNVFKPFPNIYKWIKIITRSLKSSVVLFVICAFCCFVFGVFGMSLFGGRFCDMAEDGTIRPDNSIPSCGNRPRSNYDTLVQAMLTTFQIMTGDDWYNVMVNGMRARGDIFALFFVANYVIGNMILLNLLIGILLSVRTETDEYDRRKIEISEKRIAQARAESDWETLALLQDRVEKKQKRFALFDFKTEAERRAEELNAQQQRRREHEFAKHELALQSVVESSPYRNTILCITIVNTLGLALQSPFRAPDSAQEMVLRVIDIVTNVVFGLDLIIQCVAYGIILGPRSFLRRDLWNQFDLVLIVVFAVVEITSVVTHKQTTVYFVLRGVSSLRALRPIRFVSQSRGMQMVVQSLLDSIGPLGNLFVVILIVMTLFGIMGVQVFQGTFYTCNGSDPNVYYANLNLEECYLVGGRWMNAAYNFDNLGSAYMTLFVLSTMEGWTAIMFNGMDATSSFNDAPIVNFERKNCVYFLAFIIIGAIFFVNLFVSIIIDSFQKAHHVGGSAGKSGSSFLTRQQNAWIRSQHTLLSHVALIDYDGVITTEDSAAARYSAIRRIARYITRHPLFDVVVYCCIFVNFLVMAVEEYPQSVSMDYFGKVTNIFFTAVFILELTTRCIAESPKRYLASKWSRFDCVVVFLSTSALVLELVFANATFVAFFRSMRALRLLRLLRKSRRLQSVLRKFLIAMYSLTNIGGILFLILFSYGLIGMKLFGRVVFDGVITHNANFQDIFSSVLLMLRVATGGNWGDVLQSCSQSEFMGYCLDRLGNCGIYAVAQVFFCTFICIATFVLLNVFVAVILDVFTTFSDDVDIVSQWDASQFMKLWFHFDPERTYRMEARFLLTLLRHIPTSCLLGMGNIPKRRRLQHEFVFIESLNLTEIDGKIELQDLIQALCERAFKKVREVSAETGEETVKIQELPIERQRMLTHKMDRHFRRKQRDRYKPPTTSATTFPVAQRIAVQILTAYWERRKLVIEHQQRIRAAAAARRETQEELLQLTRKLTGQDDTNRAGGASGSLSAANVNSPVVVSLHDAVDRSDRWQQQQQQAAQRNASYQSVLSPRTGLLTTFRVRDSAEELSSRSSGPAGGGQVSIVDRLTDDKTVMTTAAPTLRGAVSAESGVIGRRLIEHANDPTVRRWTQDETLAVAQLVATRQRLQHDAEARSGYVKQGRLPDEEMNRVAIAAEESEARSYLSWMEVQSLAQRFQAHTASL